MKYVLITDTHFGVKNGSGTWFRSQSAFIYEQLIPYLKELSQQEEVALVHMGDVFDTRSSVPTIIAYGVIDMFEELCSVVSDFYVLQGNHDNASPNDPKYNTLELLLASVKAQNLHIVSKTLEKDNLVFIPWFDQESVNITDLSAKYEGKVLFTHADIITGNPKLYTPVFSGHVHIPYINGNVRNIGSCYPLDFHDTGSERYFYVWDPEDDSIQRIANKKSIRFWRIRNEELVERDWMLCGQNDYIEIYIKFSLLQSEKYQSICKEMQRNFKNCWVIPLPDELQNNEVNINYNIDNIIESSIPEDLRGYFELIKQKTIERAEQRI